jgi:hypothetical protein
MQLQKENKEEEAQMSLLEPDRIAFIKKFQKWPPSQQTEAICNGIDITPQCSVYPELQTLEPNSPEEKVFIDFIKRIKRPILMKEVRVMFTEMNKELE